MRGVIVLFAVVFFSGIHSISCKCQGTTAAMLDVELREYEKKPLLSFSLKGFNATFVYDKGGILKWNCTDDENQSQQNTSIAEEGQSATNLSPVTLEGSDDVTDPFISSSGNTTKLNTYALLYRNIFGRREDETAAYSSNILVQVPTNISSEENTTLKSIEGTTPAIARTTGDDTATVEESLQEHNNRPSILVNILLGEKHGITILNALNPENSDFINKTDVDAFGITYIYTTRTIFFTTKGEIRSTGNTSLVVSAGVDGPVRLAVDWVHGRLYWLSYKHQTVEVVNLDGSNRSLLVDVTGVKFPNNIEVDPYDKTLFFVANNSMYRTGLDGRDMMRYNLPDNRTARCLALDVPSKRLFFSGNVGSPGRPYVASCDYDGRTTVSYHELGDSDWNDVFSLDVFRGVVYFAHYDPHSQDSVWAFNTSWVGKRPVSVYVEPEARGGIWSIKVFHSEVQKQSDKRRE